MPTSKLNFTVNVPTTSLPFTVGNIYIGDAFNNLISTPISLSSFTYTTTPVTQTLLANKRYGLISITITTQAYYIRYEYYYSSNSASYTFGADRWYYVASPSETSPSMLSHCLFMSNESTPRLLCGVYEGASSNSQASTDAIIPTALVYFPFPSQ